jgi:UDP-glucose:(heptosyl)LPS alpha-1,3-glucosyltransferase
MKRPRIAVVSLYYGESGGAELFASEVTDRLAASGEFDVHVLAHRWKDRTGKIAFHRVDFRKWPRSLQKRSLSLSVRKVAAVEGFDLVHAHELLDVADVVTFGAPVALWPKIQGKRGATLRTIVNQRIERRLLLSDRLRCILATSNQSVRWLMDEYPELTGRPIGVTTLYPGVDPRRFTPPDRTEREAARAELAARFGWNASDPVGLFVGNDWERKSLGSTLEAMGILQKKGYPMRLLVMGSERKKERWLAAMRAVGLRAPDVAFLGEVGEGREMFFRTADFLLFLSRFENFGMVVLEAVASGLPVILSGRVPAREILPPDGGSVIEDPMDAFGASQAMEAWIRNPAARERLASQAVEVARAYSWEAAAEKTAAVYRDCLARKRE